MGASPIWPRPRSSAGGVAHAGEAQGILAMRRLRAHPPLACHGRHLAAFYVAWAPLAAPSGRSCDDRALDKTRYAPFAVASTEGEFVSQIRAMGVLPGHGLASSRSSPPDRRRRR
jgi:hypothetical protein